MALHDIAAQAAGLPLYRFLGGKKRPMETDLTIYIGDPAAAGDRALQVLEKGFRIIKTKVGVSVREDVRRLAAIRAAVGDGPAIRIDANQGWGRMEAVECLRAMAELRIEFCEQPVRAHDVAGMRFVTDRSPIPPMADESIFSPADALRLIEAGAAPYFNIKLSKSGGIHDALSIARLAEAGGIRCMVGCMLESRLGIAAAAHFALATEAIAFYDLDSFFEHAESPVPGGVEIRDGMIDLSEEPGLGARPDPDFLKRLTRV
jgi:L-alanine-DL-glutamate epimerase-like enolase superfamily enzyme